MDLKYRADIDGLRAIAVLAVIFFHTDIPGFSGGFVGVDIFFVISGFLITSIILKEIQGGNFSIARFYERRIRRIFPALFPVIVFTLVIGAFVFNFRSFKDLGQSITATTLFSSNILFWHNGGYFAASSLQKPLLHTWSLAVEEQFYIFYPIMLIAISRFGKKRYLEWVLGIGFASLILSIWGVYINQKAVFYWVPTRAWELLAGSILALGIIPLLQSNFWRNFSSLLGLGLIIYSIGFYTEATLFPGAHALMPVLGASLIIYSGIGGASAISKLLSIRLVVYIGLISYSLYLWHWPLIAFSRYFLLRDLTYLEVVELILITFIISVLSLKFIEQPFRGKQPIIQNRKVLFVLSSIVMLSSSLIGVVISVQNGMPYRYPEANAALMRVEQTEAEFFHNFSIIIEKNNNGNIPTLIGANGKVPSFVLWGDSHAVALMLAIIDKAKHSGVSGFAIYGKPPVLGLDLVDTPENEALRNEESFALIESHPECKTVILAARWAMYATGHESKNELPRINHRLNDVRGDYSNNQLNSVLLRIGLSRVVDTLLSLGKNVVLVMDVPEIGFDVLNLGFLSSIKGENYYRLLPTQLYYHQRNKDVEDMFSELAKRPNVTIIYPGSLMFDKNSCALIMESNNFLYRDDDHLSSFGARFIASIFDDVFKNMDKRH
ncbi:MAG: acyltransferase family protein [Bacteroidia bacterium]|nr:acyltransferase family protein [Bacteroidia bacterium]